MVVNGQNLFIFGGFIGYPTNNTTLLKTNEMKISQLPKIVLGLNDYFTVNGVAAKEDKSIILCGNFGLHFFSDKGFKSIKFS